MDPSRRRITLPHDPNSSESLELLSRAEAGIKGSSEEGDEPSGPKLTGFRILNTVLVAAFGLSKAALTYQGKSAAPTTLELVLGVFLGIGLYWIGLYESVRPHKWPWLLHDDYLVHKLPIARFTVVCLRVTFITTGIFFALIRTCVVLVPILVEPLQSDQGALSWIKFALYFLFPALGLKAYDVIVKLLSERGKALIHRAWMFCTHPFRQAPGGNGEEWKDLDYYAQQSSVLPSMVITFVYFISLLDLPTESEGTPPSLGTGSGPEALHAISM